MAAPGARHAQSSSHAHTITTCLEMYITICLCDKPVLGAQGAGPAVRRGRAIAGAFNSYRHTPFCLYTGNSNT